jgi:hypothetical protein
MIASAVRGNVSLAQSVAPKGARGIAIHAPHAFGHIPPGATTKNLFSRAQAIFQRNVPRLTRWLGSPQPMAEPISLNRMAHRTAQSVQERMSFSSRMAVSRPLKAAGMPRPPVIARSMHEVGLGTARKFSSQTVFHHFVENTSITTRAFWEANWDLKAAEERKIWAKRPEQKKSGQTKRTSRSSARAIIPVTVASSIQEEEDEMSLYFAHPAEPSVTTFLQIALASTPSATLPLAAAANNALYLLPLRSLLDTHAQFQARTQDVTAIFTRLDAENVWNRGVTAETWGDTAGLCVELRVKFSGWSEQDVRGLLGGLIDVPGCAVQEYITPTAIADEEEDNASQFSPAVTQLEFVMPTASFDSEPITRSSSPSVSDITFLDLLEESISSGMVTPHSAGSISEWGDSEPLSVFDNQPNTMLMSLSSAFLVRLQEVESFASPM